VPAIPRVDPEFAALMSFAAFNCSKILFDQGATLDTARSLAPQWAAAFNAGDIDALLELYDPAAELFASPTAEPIAGIGALRRFFGQLAADRPSVRLAAEAGARRLSDRSAFIEGQYDFARGENTWIKAHYRFLLVRHIRSWRISEHHSTTMTVTVV
jgi:uncharacterized protein (TIGR02246 family)